jgi:hypothetical protein
MRLLSGVMTTLPQGAVTTLFIQEEIIIMTIYGLSSTIAPCEGNYSAAFLLIF